ncbi:MAG TPA: hypothetical protein VJ948_09880 [Acidimicrobiia bacterium]|nr:hypothetical protein [Acidimicrobiia bacterium]
MRFKGQLLLPDENGPGLRVNLDVAAHHLAVESESGGLGAWPLEVVDVRRLEGDVFAMTVAGESLHFRAEDAISFAYSGLPALTRDVRPKTRSAFRGWLSNLWAESPQPPPETAQSETLEEPVLEVVEPIQLEDSASRLGEIDLHWNDDRAADVSDVSTPAGSSPGDPFEVEDWISPEEPGRDRQAAPGCRGRRQDGQPCQSPIVTPSGYCVSHDPRRTVADGYRNAREARARLKERSTARLNQVYTRLDKAMRQVERGELDPEIAMAMAQLAQTMCAILDLDSEPGKGRQG